MPKKLQILFTADEPAKKLFVSQITNFYYMVAAQFICVGQGWRLFSNTNCPVTELSPGMDMNGVKQKLGQFPKLLHNDDLKIDWDDKVRTANGWTKSVLWIQIQDFCPMWIRIPIHGYIINFEKKKLKNF